MIAGALADRINGININGEEVRLRLYHGTGFSSEEQIRHSANLGHLARFIAEKQELPVIVDYAFSTEAARQAFGKPDILVWVDTLDEKVAEWQDPQSYDHRITVTGDDYLDKLPTRAFTIIQKFGLFDWKADTGAMVDSYQNWGPEHLEEYDKLSADYPQVMVGVKHTSGMTENDKLFYHEIKNKIVSDRPNAVVLKVPNIKN